MTNSSKGRLLSMVGFCRNHSLQILSVGILIIMCCALLILMYQNEQLKQQLEFAIMERSSILEIGKTFVMPRLNDVSGLRKQLDDFTSQRNSLFAIFSTTCPHCDKNWNIWRTLYSGLDSSKTRMLGISIHEDRDTREYLKKNQADFPVVIGDSTFLSENSITNVPLTVLVGKDGVVKGVWLGVLETEVLDDVIRAVGL